MKKMFVVYAILLLACAINVKAQTPNNKEVLRYIDRYRSLAMSEQQRTGIPAAIKLAQGIHETGAGTSKLATEANNHFGLKCKSDWKGQTYKYTDDAPNECFRKYNMDFESFQDQSNYLKANPRYASLFTLSITDYAGWAMGLRKAGYATNPKYPILLIKIIEDYKLQEYTYSAMGDLNNANVATTTPVENNYNQQPAYNNRQSQYNNTPPPANTYGQAPANTSVSQLANTISGQGGVETINNAPPQRTSKYIDTKPRDRQMVSRSYQNGSVQEQPVDNATYNVVKINNLKAVYGKRGDMPLQYAVRNGIRYEKFLEMNDLEEKPLPADMPLYLERKHFWGIRPMHLVKPGETMIVIAQKEGIQLKYLRDLNYMEADEEPMPGVTLELQAQAGTKPAVEKRREEAVVYNDNGNGGDNEDAQSTEGNNNNVQYTPSAPVYRPNPAPPYQEEKPLWEKMKEARLARRQAKGLETPAAATATPPVQQPAQQQPVQSYQQRQQPANTQAAVKPNPAAQNYSNNTQTATTAPARNTPPPAQQQTYQQQPVQSYSSSQYSYSNSGVKANPAAQYVETKPERKSRKKRNQEALQPVATQPQVQKPKTELDLLKEQFDNVIYADNSKAPAAQPQQRQPAYQQQQSYQQQNTRQTQQQVYNQQPQAQPQQAYTQQQQSYEQQPQAQAQTRVDPSKTYTVKRGDTAYTIAKKHGITIRQLMDWNGLDFEAIKEGQNLKVKP